MLRVRFDNRKLLEWARAIPRKKAAMRGASAKALNIVGERTVQRIVDAATAQTGLTSEVVRRNVRVKRANANDLSFTIDASPVFLEQAAQRPMVGRSERARRPNDFFRPDELVKIVTMGDEQVCEICQRLAEEGPYPIGDARAHLPAHPRCRCVVEPYRDRRKLPVEFRRGRAPTEGSQVTINELIEQLKTEVRIVLRVKQ